MKETDGQTDEPRATAYIRYVPRAGTSWRGNNSTQIARQRTPAFTGVCMFRFPHDISKTEAAGITICIPDVEMFHNESWRPIYFGVTKVKDEGH